MTIRKKLILAYFISALLIAVLAFYAVDMSQRYLIVTVGNDSMSLAEEMFKHIRDDIQHVVDYLELENQDALLQENLSQSNQSFDNTAVLETAITPFIRASTTSQLSNNLKQKFIKFWKDRQGYTIFSEVLVTNKYGLNVSQIGKTSGYYQANELWWITLSLIHI